MPRSPFDKLRVSGAELLCLFPLVVSLSNHERTCWVFQRDASFPEPLAGIIISGWLVSSQAA